MRWNTHAITAAAKALFSPVACAALALASLGSAAEPASAATVYVNASLATGADNGTSWADAYRTVDGVARALNAAAAGDSIWVAAGTYKPTTTATRTIYHNLRSGIAVYGGFTGTESSLAQRNPATNTTTLSGDLAGNDPATITDNSFHVVNGNGADATGVLDGFTVTGGNSNGAAASDTDRGGGLIFLNGSNATIRNCRIVGNRVSFGGGGTYIRNASPTFVDCTWESNLGASFGGAIDMFTTCNPTFTRCAFIGNSANRAGGVEVFGSCQPVFTNCIFRNNSAGSASGGGLFVASSSTVTLRHTTIARNTSTATTGGAVLSSGSLVRYFNCIVYSNTASGGSTVTQLAGATHQPTYSCIQGGFAGTGNITSAPNFANEAAGNLRLTLGSPCIDASQNSESGAGNTVDFDLLPRFLDDPSVADTGVGPAPIADMGAFEFNPCPVPLSIATPPSSAVSCLTRTVSFTVVAAGSGPYTYKWRKGGIDINTGSNPSAATATLTLSNITAADAGSYDVIVSNLCSSQPAGPVSLSLLPDFNADGSVNTADLTLMLGNFGSSGVGFAGGDANQDSTVNTADLTNLLGEFGTACP